MEGIDKMEMMERLNILGEAELALKNYLNSCNRLNEANPDNMTLETFTAWQQINRNDYNNLVNKLLATGLTEKFIKCQNFAEYQQIITDAYYNC